jgi:hypothetical protein
MIFVLVGIAGFRKRAETGSNTVLVLLSIAVTGVVLGFFAVDTYQNAPQTFTAIIGIGVLAVGARAVDGAQPGSPGRRGYERRPAKPGRQRLTSPAIRVTRKIWPISISMPGEHSAGLPRGIRLP